MVVVHMDVVEQLVVHVDFSVGPIHLQQRPNYEDDRRTLDQVDSLADLNSHELVYHTVQLIFRNRVAGVHDDQVVPRWPNIVPKDYFDNPKNKLITCRWSHDILGQSCQQFLLGQKHPVHTKVFYCHDPYYQHDVDHFGFLWGVNQIVIL